MNWKKGFLAALVIAMLVIVPIEAQIQSTRDATSAFIKESAILASAARTASGDSTTVIDLAAYASGNIFIDVTAVSGTTPSMTVTFQSCSTTTTTDCYDHTAGAAITVAGKQLVKVNNFGRYGFVKFAITGTTPSFTFSVKGAFKPQT